MRKKKKKMEDEIRLLEKRVRAIVEGGKEKREDVGIKKGR